MTPRPSPRKFARGLRRRNDMIGAALVGLGGAIGALLRYGLSLAAAKAFGAGFPWGTLCANALGGAAMGALYALAGHDRHAMLLLGTGLLGGFTTFSAFSLETVLMIERGAFALAAAYAFGSVAVAIGALFLSLSLTRSFA